MKAAIRANMFQNKTKTFNRSWQSLYVWHDKKDQGFE